MTLEIVIAFVIALVLALLAGAALGGFAAARRLAEVRAERDRREADFKAAIVDLAAAQERLGELPELRAQLGAIRDERDIARLQLTELRVKADGFEQRLTGQFRELAGEMLSQTQEAFLKRAEDRFSQSETAAGQNLKALLQPVNERLQRYEEGVAKVEAERRDAFGELKGQIEQMRIGQERVSSEAAKLVNSLRNAPKSRGRWGEQQLKNVLESCGLSEHTDFQTEVSVGTEDGRLRPDAIVRVPGGKALVIDAKVSLNAYQDAFGAVEEGERQAGLGQHAAAMKAHVNSLGNKAYWNQFDDAPDYVIMFVPGEHFLSAALEHDPQLWDFAFEKRVLLATPTNLIAIARTVAAVWRQERMAKEARQIGELGKELYDRLAKAMQDLRVVGTGLNTAVKNFNTFASSMESRALVSARKLRDYHIEPGTREIETIAPVELLAGHAEQPGDPDHAEQPGDPDRAEAAE